MGKKAKLILKGISEESGQPFKREIRTLDEVRESGQYTLVGYNVSEEEGLPPAEYDDCNYCFIEALLSVTRNSSTLGIISKETIGQTITISNREDGGTNIYNRSWSKGKNNEEWTPWLMMLRGDISVVAPTNDLNEKVSVVAESLRTEKERAKNAEKGLQEAIDAEAANAKDAHNSIMSDITEQSNRITQTNINLHKCGTARFDRIEENVVEINKGEIGIENPHVVYYKPKNIFVAVDNSGKYWDRWDGMGAYISGETIRKDKLYLYGDEIFIYNSGKFINAQNNELNKGIGCLENKFSLKNGKVHSSLDDNFSAEFNASEEVYFIVNTEDGSYCPVELRGTKKDGTFSLLKSGLSNTLYKLKLDSAYKALGVAVNPISDTDATFKLITNNRKDIINLRNRYNLIAYISNQKKPSFETISSGGTKITLPEGCNLRIYNNNAEVLCTYAITNADTFEIPAFYKLVINTETGELSIKLMTEGNLGDVVLFTSQSIGIVDGLLTPYYYEWKQMGYIKQVSVQDAMSDNTDNIEVVDGGIKIYKGFSLIVGDVRYPIACGENYIINTLDDTDGTRVSRSYVYIDTSVLSPSEANYLNGENAKNIFKVSKSLEKDATRYILFATFYYQTASGGLIDVYKGRKGVDNSNGVINLYKNIKPLYEQLRFRSDFTALFFSDIHASVKNMERIVELSANWPADTILNGGDTVERFNGDGLAWFYTIVNKSKIDVLSAVGNHDAWSANWVWAPKSDVYNAVIAPAIEKVNNIVKPDGEELYYYKDYNNKVRVIVLETTLVITATSSTSPYWDEAQNTWMKNVLEDARINNLSVICLAHAPFEKSDGVIDSSITFNSWTGYKEDIVDGKVTIQHDNLSVVDAALANVDNFINNGGKFICWLAGHTHLDYFVQSKYHPKQVMFVTSSANYEKGKDYALTSDESSANFDCMNYISADITRGWLKILRIGKNIDGFMRKKKVLVWDYVNNKLIANY